MSIRDRFEGLMWLWVIGIIIMADAVLFCLLLPVAMLAGVWRLIRGEA